jgi:hypothetical protein
VEPAIRTVMTNVAMCPATTSTEASVSCGHTPVPAGHDAGRRQWPGRHGAAETRGDLHDQRGTPDYARDALQNEGRRRAGPAMAGPAARRRSPRPG